MKNRIFAVLICLCLVVSIFLPFSSKVYADPGLLSQMAALTFAYGNSIGFDMTMQGASAAFAQNWTENLLTDYSQTSGKSITEIFGEEAIRVTAGKIAAGHRAINGAQEVLQWIKDMYNLDTIKEMIGYNDVMRPAGDPEQVGENWAYGVSASVERVRPGYNWMYTGYYTPYQGSSASINLGYEYQTGNFEEIVFVPQANNKIVINWYFVNSHGASWVVVDCAPHDQTIYAQLGESYVEPTVLNPTQEWVGDYGGAADTNLDQLVQDIFENVADISLDVEGEVIDAPVPPTPVPTIEPGDIDGYWNRQSDQMEGLGNDIGDISGKLDDLGQQAGDITDALEGVNQGIQTQTGVISGALDQAAQDVADAIGEQTQTLDESLTQTAEGVQDIADALQPGEIEPKKFDLRRLFPFCIPFDIHNLLQKFDADPVAPHVQLPFVITSLNFSYMFDLDFSAFDSVASAMRTVEFIVFALGLAWATSKVIKW